LSPPISRVAFYPDTKYPSRNASPSTILLSLRCTTLPRPASQERKRTDDTHTTRGEGLVLAVLLQPLLIVQAQQPHSFVRKEGDVMLAAMFDVNNAKNGSCGDYDVREVQSVFAVEWFIDKLNQINYIPGYHIATPRTMEAAVQLKEHYITGSNSSQQAPLVGLVGPSRTSEVIPVSQFFSSLPASQQLPQISGSATGVALGNKTQYPNFLRVIPPDDVQIKGDVFFILFTTVITKLLLELRWNYIAIVYIDDDYGTTAATALRQEAERQNICVPVFDSLPTNTKSSAFITSVNDVIFSEALRLQSSALTDNIQVLEAAKGSLMVTPRHREMEEFREAWNTLWINCSYPPPEVTDHPWLQELHALHKGSNCQALRLKPAEELLYPWYHVQAAAVFAAVIKRKHAQDCAGASVPCTKFLSHLRELTSQQIMLQRSLDLEAEFLNISSAFYGVTDVRFSSSGEVLVGTDHEETLYEIHNFRTCGGDSQFCFRKVGNFFDGNISLNYSQTEAYPPDTTGPVTWDNLAPAQCSDDVDCLECRRTDLAESALIVEGDFYFVAMVPVHTSDPDNPLQCGAIRPDLGADFVESILFALDKVNEPDGRFSSIMKDSCFNALSVKEKLIQLHKGRLRTPRGVVDVSAIVPQIAGYIGGFFSDVSFAMSDILTLLNRPAYVHFSPTSVSPKLSDRQEHPYFMRLTVPANSEITAMLDILNTVNASFVQIIFNPDDAYSVDLTQEFESEALKRNVCVAQTVRVPVKSKISQYYPILDTLRVKNSARLVIVILQYEQVIKVMEAMVEVLTAEDRFLFLGSEAWAGRLEVVRGRSRLSGSITLAEEIALDQNFTTYFRHTNPVTSRNFWLRDYWEAKENCFFDGSFQRKDKSSQCPDDVQMRYDQDPWVSYFVQAVYAFAEGVGNALRSACSESATTLCASLKSEQIVNHMKEVRLDLFNTGEERPVFDSNGDGENGYKVMQAVKNPQTGQLAYRQVGTWSAGKGLELTVSVTDLANALPADLKTRGFNSRCTSTVDCNECPAANKSASVSGGDDSQTLPLIPAVVVIAVLGVACIVLIIVTILACRRGTPKAESVPPSLRFENDTSADLRQMNYPPFQETYPPGFHAHHFRSPGTVTPRDYEELPVPAEAVTDTIPADPPVPCTNSREGKLNYLTVLPDPE
ncbi:hypothetical protein BaRGS_00024237, partial [Batillaria attramentaria]